MARGEGSTMFVVGLLLVLAHGCSAQSPQDPRTVGVGSSFLPTSYADYGLSSGGGYNNRFYSPYSYSDPTTANSYYNNYQPGGYLRQMPSTVVLPPGCQSGLTNQVKPPAGGDNSVQLQSQKTGGSQQQPKASQTIATQSSNLQQSVVQQSPLFPQFPPIIHGSSLQYPYGLRAADNTNSGFPENSRMVPKELYFVDPTDLAGRQAITILGKPETLLTYDSQDMVHAYGAGNFQPPIFGLYPKTQSAQSYRGLGGGYSNYQYAYPPIDSRYLGSGSSVQQIAPQRRIEHPLPVLRQSAPIDHTNQPLPPNMYGTRKWEPVTNLQVETPLDLGRFDNTAVSGQNQRSSSTPCREKRQIDPWMYPSLDWSDLDVAQQRAAAVPPLPGLAPPLTPYHGPYSPLSEIFPSRQQFLPPSPNYLPGYDNPHTRGAVEGIQHFVTGIAQMVPMFTSGVPVYKK